MFQLRKIELTNFRSYKGTHSFEFPLLRGLYFLTGSNNTELGSNGSGKSTLLDAIIWALYNRTARGLKANEVISWGATNCSVALELTIGPAEFIIKRSQKPNALSINGNPVDQDELQKYIRLNFDSFLYSVINPQFGESFLALSPTAKLILFSDIMGLDFWLEKSDAAAKKADLISWQVEELKRILNQLEGQRTALVDEIKHIKEAASTFDSNQKVKIATIKQEITNTISKSISIEEKLERLGTQNAEKLKRLQAMLEVNLKFISKTAREHAENIGELKALKRQREEYHALSGECPTCHQQVDTLHINTHLSRIQRQELTIEQMLPAIEKDLEMGKRHLLKTKLSIEDLTAEINAVRDRKSEVKMLANKVADLRAKIKELRNEENPFHFNLKSRQLTLDKVNNTISVDLKILEKAEADYAATLYWVKGFKRVRLFIIEQAFTTLELEINNSLAQLGMSDWQITLDVERENKSGGVTKGFVVFVQGPNNKEPVRWENWSGGETQRLQLAGDLGLANLIMVQNGLVNTFEAYDEPSQHLSPEGMMDLANLLHERAVTENKTIWIADHTSIANFGDFQGIIKIKKDDNGSSITYSGSNSRS